jgi:hypothetical protein
MTAPQPQHAPSAIGTDRLRNEEESGEAARSARFMTGRMAQLALTRLEPPVRFVDDIGPAAAANDTAIPVARLQRLQ